MNILRFWIILVGASALSMTLNYANWGKLQLFSPGFWIQLMGATIATVALAMILPCIIWIFNRKTSREFLLGVALVTVGFMCVARFSALP
jgi:hypothetical protein